MPSLRSDLFELATLRRAARGAMSAHTSTARNYERWAKPGKPWMARRLCRRDAGQRARSAHCRHAQPCAARRRQCRRWAFRIMLITRARGCRAPGMARAARELSDELRVMRIM
jgi:hypothetical protein